MTGEFGISIVLDIKSASDSAFSRSVSPVHPQHYLFVAAASSDVSNPETPWSGVPCYSCGELTGSPSSLSFSQRDGLDVHVGLIIDT